MKQMTVLFVCPCVSQGLLWARTSLPILFSIIHISFNMPIRSRPSSDHDTVPPARRKQAEAKHSKDYYDPEGDLEILSSDNVLFKLHAYRLQASSCVLLEISHIALTTDPFSET